MSKGNLSNTKIRSQLRKNKNDKGKNFYVSKNVSFNPESNLLTYEIEGKIKTATLSQEAAKNYRQYFRRCTNGYALDYLVKHQFRLNESTYRILKLSTRFSTPAEIGEYIKSLEQKFTILERKCPQNRREAVKFIHSIISSNFEKQSNSKISIVHDLFFPDITDVSTTVGLIGGKEVKVFSSPYVDCVNYTTYVDNEYRIDKLINVEYKGGNNVSYDYFPALVCQNLYNKCKGVDERKRRNIIINQIRGIIIASKEELKKNIANSTFFPYTTDSYFKTGINNVYGITPTDDVLSKDVDMNMLFETMNYSPDFGWFNETNEYSNKIYNWEYENKNKNKSAKTIYLINYNNNLYYSGYDEKSAKVKALSAAIFYTIEANKKNGIYNVNDVFDELKDYITDKTIYNLSNCINYSINNELTYDLSDTTITTKIVNNLFNSDGSPKNINIALTFITNETPEKENMKKLIVDKFDVETSDDYIESSKYTIDDLLADNPDELTKAKTKFDTWLNQSTDDPLLINEDEPQPPIQEQIEKKEEPPAGEKKKEPEVKEGLSRRKLKKMGLSKRQIKRIMRIVEKPKAGVTENDTLNEIKELLKVMVAQVKPSAVNVADKPVDKITTNVETPKEPTKTTILPQNKKPTQFNPSDILGQREKLKPTTTVKYEPPKEFNLKSEIEAFDKSKLNHTMQGLAKILKKGDISKQQSIIKKIKIHPITAHLIKMVGTNQKAEKYMGGIFSKLASMIPYGSQIYEVAKKVYNVAKPVIEKVIKKYDNAYDKKMNGYLSTDQLKDYLIKNEKPKLKTLNKILK